MFGNFSINLISDALLTYIVLTIDLFSGSLLSIFDIFVSLSDTLSVDYNNEAIIDLMLSAKLFLGSLLPIFDIFLSISDTLSIDCDNKGIIDLMVSVKLFSGSFLLISDKLSRRHDTDAWKNLLLSINFNQF